LLGQSNGAGIYHYEFRSFGTPIGDSIRLRQPSIRRIVPPEHDRIGVFEVGSWKPATKGEGMSEILMPVAYLRGVADVRAAEVPHEAFDPIDAVRDRRAARASNRESYCSAPFSSRTAASFCAVSVSASSQLIRFHPGLFAPLGVVLRMG
jgi:hypothetical protein